MTNHNPPVSMIVAIGKNREMGKNDRLLWSIPEDLKFFKDMTRGHVNIMGRKTFENLLRDYKGKQLPKRVTVVVTRDKDYKAPDGVFVFNDIKKATEFAKSKELEISKLDEFTSVRDPRSKNPEVFNIGGGQIFRISMPYTDRIYLTFIDAEFPGADTYFPEFSDFKRVVEERKSQDQNYTYTFKTLER